MTGPRFILLLGLDFSHPCSVHFLGFELIQRIHRDAGGYIVLTPTPVELQLDDSHSSADSPTSTTVNRVHQYTSSLALPPGCLRLTPHSTHIVCLRCGSFDGLISPGIDNSITFLKSGCP